MSLDSYTDKQLQEELKSRDERRETLAALPKEHRLAIYLHGSLCRWNHTDGCAWYYELRGSEHKWEEAAHQRWLKKAKAALAVLDDTDVIVRLLEAVR